MHPPQVPSRIDTYKSLLEERLQAEIAALPKPSPVKQQVLQIVEDYTPFEESVLWQLQRSYFEEAGVTAWSEGTVPHYVTSNSYIAWSYVSMVLALQQDRAAAGDMRPLRILELGAGSGQFSFHFLQHYQGLASTDLPPLQYVLSDFTQANIDFCAAHPRLHPWVERGLLDFALFDVTQSDDVALMHGGTRWSEQADLPLVVIANYVWDGIPQELYLVEEGKASPVEVRISAYAQEIGRLSEEEGVTLDFRVSEADSGGEPAHDHLLKKYSEVLQATTALLFPRLALACLDRLSALCRGELLVLSADKGRLLLEAIEGQPYPQPAYHGSFSLPVNFHTLCAYVQEAGGEVTHGNREQASLQSVCLRYPQFKIGAHLQTALNNLLVANSPGDQFTLKKAIERNYTDLSFDEVLAYVRHSQYDPKALRRGLPRLQATIAGAGRQQMQQLLGLIEQVWLNYYPLGESPDLAFMLGSLLYEANVFARAKFFFEESIRLYGDDEGTRNNIAACEKMIATR